MSQFKLLVRNMETFSNVLPWLFYPLNCLNHAFVVSGLAASNLTEPGLLSNPHIYGLQQGCLLISVVVSQY